jgi:hypothetical protein
MYPKSLKLRPLTLSEQNYSDNALPNITIKQQPLRELLSIQSANRYDSKMLDNKQIPTAFEFATHKNFLNADEYKKLQDDPQYKKARTLASFQEFLFELSYFPFIKIPMRDFNG